MTGNTIIFRQGSTFNIEGQLLGEGEVPFNYSTGQIGIYDTLNINQTEIQVVPLDPILGKFTVSIPDLESKKIPEGRNSWFKLRVYYPDADPQMMVFPPIWVDME